MNFFPEGFETIPSKFNFSKVVSLSSKKEKFKLSKLVSVIVQTAVPVPESIEEESTNTIFFHIIPSLFTFPTKERCGETIFEVEESIISILSKSIFQSFFETKLDFPSNETEKNLLKIDKKLEDLSIKNKHLEQIRFVLEHRMTSLEKEKAPLEGQCTFLENQKNKLTDEFNKIILQINANNQNLENKQSQLRASLIQNYDAIDQRDYLEEKIDKLKTDLDKFIQEHKNFPEGKVTQIALDFRKFYDKYFSNSIEYELIEYKFFSQKLREQKEKETLMSNMDLIMRNKGEEKLITEKKKVDELRLVKENMFRGLHNENTILINECNRLRKNLHEIYVHVIDIEKRFEQLTNIDPTLSKSQIDFW